MSGIIGHAAYAILASKAAAARRLPVAPVIHAHLSAIAGARTYREMLEAAEAADFRHALWQMGELIADVFEKIIDRQEALQKLPVADGPGWEELTQKWRRTEK